MTPTTTASHAPTSSPSSASSNARVRSSWHFSAVPMRLRGRIGRLTSHASKQLWPTQRWTFNAMRHRSTCSELVFNASGAPPTITTSIALDTLHGTARLMRQCRRSATTVSIQEDVLDNYTALASTIAVFNSSFMVLAVFALQLISIVDDIC